MFVHVVTVRVLEHVQEAFEIEAKGIHLFGYIVG